MSGEENAAQGTAGDKDCLRVVLDPAASRSFDEMAKRLKSVGTHIKFYPSQLVSFILSDYLETYFEKDLDVVVAKFFDAKTFLSAEIQRAKSPDEALEILGNISATIEKIKSQGRAKGGLKTRSKRKLGGKKKSEITDEKQEDAS